MPASRSDPLRPRWPATAAAAIASKARTSARWPTAAPRIAQSRGLSRLRPRRPSTREGPRPQPPTRRELLELEAPPPPASWARCIASNARATAAARTAAASRRAGAHRGETRHLLPRHISIAGRGSGAPRSATPRARAPPSPRRRSSAGATRRLSATPRQPSSSEQRLPPRRSGSDEQQLPSSARPFGDIARATAATRAPRRGGARATAAAIGSERVEPNRRSSIQLPSALREPARARRAAAPRAPPRRARGGEDPPRRRRRHGASSGSGSGRRAAAARVRVADAGEDGGGGAPRRRARGRGRRAAADAPTRARAAHAPNAATVHRCARSPRARGGGFGARHSRSAVVRATWSSWRAHQRRRFGGALRAAPPRRATPPPPPRAAAAAATAHPRQRCARALQRARLLAPGKWRPASRRGQGGANAAFTRAPGRTAARGRAPPGRDLGAAPAHPRP